MAKDVPLAGSNDRGDNKFEKAQDTGSQTDYYVGSKDTGNHCHMWQEHETGKSGVEHRGECNVCDDSKKSNSNENGSSSSGGLFSFLDKLFG